jgi:hypothetical protein
MRYDEKRGDGATTYIDASFPTRVRRGREVPSPGRLELASGSPRELRVTVGRDPTGATLHGDDMAAGVEARLQRFVPFNRIPALGTEGEPTYLERVQCTRCAEAHSDGALRPALDDLAVLTQELDPRYAVLLDGILRDRPRASEGGSTAARPR